MATSPVTSVQQQTGDHSYLWNPYAWHALETQRDLDPTTPPMGPLSLSLGDSFRSTEENIEDGQETRGLPPPISTASPDTQWIEKLNAQLCMNRINYLSGHSSRTAIQTALNSLHCMRIHFPNNQDLPEMCKTFLSKVSALARNVLNHSYDRNLPVILHNAFVLLDNLKAVDQPSCTNMLKVLGHEKAIVNHDNLLEIYAIFQRTIDDRKWTSDQPFASAISIITTARNKATRKQHLIQLDALHDQLQWAAERARGEIGRESFDQRLRTTHLWQASYLSRVHTRHRK